MKATSVKIADAKPTIHDLVVQIILPPTYTSKSVVSSIALPTKHVWSWFVGSSRPSPTSPQWQPDRGLSWKPSFSSWQNMAECLMRTVRGKAMRLACWNADGVRGRKFELGHLLSKHYVHICILCEISLNPGQAFRLAHCVFHRSVRPTAVGGIVLLVRRGIVHHSVRVWSLAHLESSESIPSQIYLSQTKPSQAKANF